MVRNSSRNGYKKDVWLKKIELRAQIMIIIPGSIVNIIGGGDLYDYLMSMRIFTVIMNKIFI